MAEQFVGSEETAVVAKRAKEEDIFSAEHVNRITIGLGGTGGIYVDRLAKDLKDEAEKHGEQFIVFDSDAGSLGRHINIDREYLVETPNPSALLAQTLGYVTTEDIAGYTSIGAGNRRFLGKAMYDYYRQTYRTKIMQAAKDLNNKTRSNEFLLVMVTALGGGTGSGALIDLTRDIKGWFLESGFREPRIFGIVFIPSQSEDSIRKANGYAALKELDYVLRRDWNPFTALFLLSRDKIGIGNNDKELEETVSHFLIDLGYLPGKSAEKKPEEKPKVWDLNDLVTRLVEGGGTRLPSTIGYYTTRFPQEEINWIFDVERMTEEADEELARLSANLDRTEKALDRAIRDAESLEKDLNGIIEERAKLPVKPIDKTRGSLIRDLDDQTESARAMIKSARTNVRLLQDQKNDQKDLVEKLERMVQGLRASMEGLVEWLKSPPASENLVHVPISRDELRILRENRVWLDKAGDRSLGKLYFREIMEKLGKMESYFSETHVLKAGMFTQMRPLLNYNLVGGGAALYRRGDRNEILARHELYNLTPEGVVADDLDKAGYTLGIVSSCEENIDETRLDIGGWEREVKRGMASDATAEILKSPARSYAVERYLLLVGLRPWSVSGEEYRPRLRDLEWLRGDYEAVAYGQGPSSARLIYCHSLFYDNPKQFSGETGRIAPVTSPDKQRNVITDFWREYEPVHRDVGYRDIPLLLADIQLSIQSLEEGIDKLKEVEETLQQKEEKIDISRLSRRINRLDGSLREFDSCQSLFVGSFQDQRGRLVKFTRALSIMISIGKDPEARLNEIFGSGNRLDGVKVLSSETRKRVQDFSVYGFKAVDGLISKLKGERTWIDSILDREQEIGEVSLSQRVRGSRDEFDEQLKEMEKLVDRVREELETMEDCLAGFDKLLAPKGAQAREK